MQTLKDHSHAEAGQRRLIWYPALFLSALFFLNFLGRIILSPLMPWIEQDLDISHAQAGSLFFLLSCGYFVSMIGSGYVSSRLGHKNAISISSILCGAALALLSRTGSLWQIRVVMALAGLAAGIYLPSAIATLTRIVSREHWGKVISIHELAPNLAFLAAPLLADLFVPRLGWKSLLLGLGAGSLSLGAAYYIFSVKDDSRGQAPDLSSLAPLMKNLLFWVMVLLFSMGITGTLGIYNMLPLYMVSEHGFDPEKANSILAMSRIATLAFALLGGAAADRFGPQRTIFVVLLVTGLVTIFLGIAPLVLVPLMVFLQPVLAVGFFPAGFALLSRFMPPGSRNIVISFTVPLAFVVGGGVIPATIGIMGDHGHLGLGISFAGLFIMSGGLISYLFLKKEGENEVN